MIGWRPYLLTLVAAAFVAVAVLNAQSASKPPSCASADGQLHGQLVTSALKAYVAILSQDPSSACARSGLTNATAAACARASMVADVDRAEARAELLAIATADPTPPAHSCVWERLATLATPAASR